MCRAASGTAASPIFFRMESGPDLGSPQISVAATGLGHPRIDARVASDLPQIFDSEDGRIFGRTRVPRRAADWLIETLVVKLTVR